MSFLNELKRRYVIRAAGLYPMVAMNHSIQHT
jgi:hypothetical protein